jgi:hypothetical protein
MRSLTPAEARVIHAQLVVAEVPERRRELWSGVPRATYLAARRRAFAHGWLESRYLPDPRALGLDRVVVTLEQPFSDRTAGIVAEVRSDPGTVLAWASPETVLSVRGEKLRDGARSRDPEPGGRRSHWTVEVEELERQFPVYFDFEAGWSVWASGLVPVTYPAGLVRGSGHPAPPRALAPADRAALGDLLLAPSSPEAPSSLRLSEVFLPRRSRRLVRSGIVRRRIFPVLSEIPALADGAALTTVVFVHGSFSARADPTALLPAILRETRARPFLVAADRSGAILGLMAPMPARLRGAGRPLLELLSEHLESISVVREPLSTLHPIVDHRYERWLAD